MHCFGLSFCDKHIYDKCIMFVNLDKLLSFIGLCKQRSVWQASTVEI